MSPREGLQSILTELLVVLVFCGTFALTRFVLTKKKPDELKDAELAMTPVKSVKVKSKSPDEKADTIIRLCTEQFTKGLRMYREMVKADQDKLVTGEGFFLSLIESSVRVHKPDVALQVLERLRANGRVPAPAFIESVLKLFAARKLSAECTQVWALFGADLPPHQVILSCVAAAACEVGDVALGRALLLRARGHFALPTREWLGVMKHHVRVQDWEGAIADLRALMALELPIDNILFNTVLACCASCPAALGSMPPLLAELTLHQAKYPGEEPTVDIVTYNTMLKAFARRGDVQRCFELVEAAGASGLQADDVTFSTLLDVCVDEDKHELATVALERMRTHGVAMTTVVMTTLIKGFVRANRLDKAMQLFDSMRTAESSVRPDMVTHSMLIKAHCDARDLSTALKILEDMLEMDCPVDDVVFTILIEGCCQVGNVRLAEKLFADMLAAKIKPSIYTLTSMVKVYGSNHPQKARQIVASMEQTFGIKPTIVVFTCLISGMNRRREYAEAWQTWLQMAAKVTPDLLCYETMLHGLADGLMWRELLLLAEPYVVCAAEQRRRNPHRPPNMACMSHALAVAAGRSQVAVGQRLHRLLTEHDFHAAPPGARKKLGLE